MKTQKGFTLIELLVVIAVIGILAGILYITIDPKKQTDSAKEANILAGLAQIATQVTIQDSNSYNSACLEGTKSKKIFDEVSRQAGDDSPICNANQDSYAMSVKFNNNGVEKNYCLDLNRVYKNATADSSLGANGKFDCISGN